MMSVVYHIIVVSKNIYSVLNNNHLMKDAQWLPLNKNQKNRNKDTQDKVYSEVAPGGWYKRTYDAMIQKHRENHSAYPALLVALVLGQDGTLCDKVGQVSSEPIIVSVANISYKKPSQCLVFYQIHPSVSKSTIEISKG